MMHLIGNVLQSWSHHDLCETTNMKTPLVFYRNWVNGRNMLHWHSGNRTGSLFSGWSFWMWPLVLLSMKDKDRHRETVEQLVRNIEWLRLLPWIIAGCQECNPSHMSLETACIISSLWRRRRLLRERETSSLGNSSSISVLRGNRLHTFWVECKWR